MTKHKVKQTTDLVLLDQHFKHEGCGTCFQVDFQKSQFLVRKLLPIKYYDDELTL